MSELRGLRVLVTRPRAQSAGLVEALQARGAVPVLLPTIEIGPLADTRALDRALGQIEAYDWLVLTSVNGVESVHARMQALGRQELPAGVKVAAIGPKTAAALESRGVIPDFVPDEFVAEAILPGLGDIQGRWVLLPRADIARAALPEAIQACGGIAHEITAYRTLPARPDPDGLRGLREGVDVVTFTSSSTVRNFVIMAEREGLDPRRLPGNPINACIGPITAETARSLGLTVTLCAPRYTVEGLLEALQTYYSET